MWARKAMLTGIALIFAASQPVSAQAYAQVTLRQPWWLSAEVQSEVGLTLTQVQRLDAIYRESLPARRRLRQQLRTLQDRWTRLLDRGQLDDAHARRVIERVVMVEKQRNMTRTWMLVRMYRVLTPEQRAMPNTLSVRLSYVNVPR
jgi:Spy/CpxP family protein refolding chaperone